MLSHLHYTCEVLLSPRFNTTEVLLLFCCYPLTLQLQREFALSQALHNWLPRPLNIIGGFNESCTESSRGVPSAPPAATESSEKRDKDVGTWLAKCAAVVSYLTGRLLHRRLVPTVPGLSPSRPLRGSAAGHIVADDSRDSGLSAGLIAVVAPLCMGSIILLGIVRSLPDCRREGGGDIYR